MGQELDCTMHFQRRSVAGRAHLESDHLLFRGSERLKIFFKDLTGVKASDGTLRLEFAGGPASFELGKAAEKWADKILHPPSRLDKLGVKEGVTVALVGSFEADFVAELSGRKALASGKQKADLVCFAADTAVDLSKIRKLAATLPPKGALWVIYPKGVSVVREAEVIESGRAEGLKDVKVASFSATHTALKFVK